MLSDRRSRESLSLTKEAQKVAKLVKRSSLQNWSYMLNFTI